jgi:ferrochelatase
VKLAVILFNLGGPDSPEAVRPFLQNLFSDPAIINLPALFRIPLARFIAARRAPIARAIYEKIGGKSPILAETQAQARALEEALSPLGHEVKCFIAMRCWHPFTREAVTAAKAWGPDKIVLLPLYPQFSTTTTQSSLNEWRKEAARQELRVPQHEICCYPFEAGFVNAVAKLVEDGLARMRPGLQYRVLFSAHGLPKRIIDGGDPYRWQVERTVEAILKRLDRPGLDWTICFQSRVGRLEWIKPATDAEITRGGAEGKGLIVVPVAFVSEHSETLVELDIEYGHVAHEGGVPDYIRVPTVQARAPFIEGLAELVAAALGASGPITCAPGRICPQGAICGHDRTLAYV